MEVGRAVAVFDPYDWLPGYGENGVELRAQGGDLSVVISYDGEHCELKKEFFFKHAVAFFKASFPGPGMLNMQCSVKDTGSIGTLKECPDSEAAKAWRAHFNEEVNINHYSIVFLSENITLVVFAEEVILRDVVVE